MLRDTSAVVECMVVGTSMGPSIPAGANVRIRLDGAADAAPETAVALLLWGDTFTIHRLVRRGRSVRARGFVVTHGDGNVFCDAPQREADLLGTVIAVRAGAGGSWEPVPPRGRRGWRGAATLAFERVLGAALELSPRCAVALKSALVLLVTPFVWLNPYDAGRQRGASRLTAPPSTPPK